MDFEIDISNRQEGIPVDVDKLHSAIVRTLQLEQVTSAVLSVSIVSNDAIHVLNRQHLNHDYPTDVMSFQLDYSEEGDFESPEDSDLNDDELPEDDEPYEQASYADSTELRAAGAMIEGDIIASAEMAASMAAEGQWSTQDELTLYVVHGLLHICGYDDLCDEEKLIMRSRERSIMASLGLKAVYAEDAAEQ
jgi:probable rRNA maturation factor